MDKNKHLLGFRIIYKRLWICVLTAWGKLVLTFSYTCLIASVWSPSFFSHLTIIPPQNSLGYQCSVNWSHGRNYQNPTGHPLHKSILNRILIRTLISPLRYVYTQDSNSSKPKEYYISIVYTKIITDVYSNIIESFRAL